MGCGMNETDSAVVLVQRKNAKARAQKPPGIQSVVLGNLIGIFFHGKSLDNFLNSEAPHGTRSPSQQPPSKCPFGLGLGINALQCGVVRGFEGIRKCLGDFAHLSQCLLLQDVIREEFGK
jgi:hypothetical protein